jgi:type II secretory pathway pseudopilin PulG
MCKSRALSLSELLVVIVILALIIGVLFPVLSSRMRSSAHASAQFHVLSVLHQAQLFFAQDNNDWYAGYDRDGGDPTGHVFNGSQQIEARGGAGTWGSGNWDVTSAATPAWRFRRLFENNYFTPEYLISPIDNRSPWVIDTPLTPDNFSFAMLQIDTDGDGNYVTTARTSEYKSTNNYGAAVMADRCIRSGSGVGRTYAGIRSIHTNPSDLTANDWKGSVVWNDNHVSFESSPVVETVYGGQVWPSDNLFLDDFVAGSDYNYDPDGSKVFPKHPVADATMVWKNDGNSDPRDQDDYVDFELSSSVRRVGRVVPWAIAAILIVVVARFIWYRMKRDERSISAP